MLFLLSRRYRSYPHIVLIHLMIAQVGALGIFLLYKLFQSHSVSRVPRRACPHQNQSLFILVLFLVLYHVSWYIQLKTVDIFPNNCYLLVDYKTCTLS